MFRRFNWYNKFGTIPSEFREAMSYEEQILWLCQQIEELKSETGNFNYSLLVNKPKINGITLDGNISSNALGIQDKLIPRKRNHNFRKYYFSNRRWQWR